MKTNSISDKSRRRFLQAAPVAAVGGVAAIDLWPALASAQATTMSEDNFQVFSAQDLNADIKALGEKDGPANSKRLFADKNFLLDLWVEKKNAGKEYEWHEYRDHIIHVLDGEAVYELGGKPKGAHSTGPGEWLAPAMDGAKTLTLKKGDILVIRRNTAHKRTTSERVVFTLTAPVTPTAG